MKNNILLIVLVLLSLFAITGCVTNKTKANNTSVDNTIKKNNSSIVLCFSATGTTEIIAQRIAKEANCDIIQIIPKEKYKSEDLNYNSDCRANREQNDPKARPEIDNEIDITKYDTIYLGYPIWWGTNPKIILTLLDTYDFYR